MNLLTDQLPEAVEIDGHEYPVNTDFRACLRSIMAFEDPELSTQEKYAVMLTNLYPEIPPNREQAVMLGVKFLNGGEEASGEAGDSYRLYSFAKDGNFIFAAFQQTHRIDLETAQLHWWKFLALFMDLGSETTFCGLISLRKRIHAGTASKEEMREYREHRESIEVPQPDTRTLEEKEREAIFMARVEERRRQRNESRP